MTFSVSRTALVSALLFAAVLSGEADAREVPGSDMLQTSLVDTVSAGAEVNIGRELMTGKKVTKKRCKKRPGKPIKYNNEGNEGDEGNEGNEGNEGQYVPNDGNEGDEGMYNNEGNEGDEGNEGNEGDEGLEWC